MNRYLRRAIGVFLVVIFLSAGLLMPVTRSSTTNDLDEVQNDGPVWIVPIHGTIDLGLAEFVNRIILEAEESRAGLLLLEINTFGGRVDAATEIRDALVASGVPTAAYISERAISAGALIALAAEQIAMAPGATIGAAEPRPLDAKTLSYVRAEFAATADLHARDRTIAAAMVDASIAIDELVEEGEILTLTASKASELGFIDHVSQSRHEAISHLGYGGAETVETHLSWAESVVRFLTDPTVAQILLAIGFLGLLIEVTSPGWGVPGSIGVVSFALFFGSRLIVGLLGVEAILLFALGLVLLAIEVFVIPGFGLAGVLGIASVGASLFLSFPDPLSALQAMAITAVSVVVLSLFFLRHFQRSSLWGRLILTQQQAADDYRLTQDFTPILGSEGMARTPLRPAGSIIIDGEYYDAISEGAMIARGETIRVIKVEGTRIVVRPIETD